MKHDDLLQEIRDNKSHLLVTMLDFCDHIKNQTRDAYYRSRLDMMVVDLKDLKERMVAGGDIAKFSAEIETTVNDLLKLKQETQVSVKGEVMDYHKALVENIKKRVHCDVNNYDRRIRLAVDLPIDKSRIEPLRDAS